jgi:hypothetical protein
MLPEQAVLKIRREHEIEKANRDELVRYRCAALSGLVTATIGQHTAPELVSYVETIARAMYAEAHGEHDTRRNVKVKRFTLKMMVYDESEGEYEMVESPDGEFVRFEDYNAAFGETR